jgi:hypothetical protein
MVTYTLWFELAPDRFTTGGPNHTTTARATLNGTVLGSVTSLPESGNDWIQEWKAFSFDVTGIFDPSSSNQLTLEYVSGQDRSRFRRIRIEGSNGLTYYGEYPAGYPYGFDLQDGRLNGEHVEMASDGSSPATQWSMLAGAFVTPSEGDDRIHLYYTVPSRPRRPVVGFIGWNHYEPTIIPPDPVSRLLEDGTPRLLEDGITERTLE